MHSSANEFDLTNPLLFAQFVFVHHKILPSGPIWNLSVVDEPRELPWRESDPIGGLRLRSARRRMTRGASVASRQPPVVSALVIAAENVDQRFDSARR